MSEDAKPDPNWNPMHTIPRCSEENCPCFDGKRCRLTGFKPDEICEPAVSLMGEVLQTIATSKMPNGLRDAMIFEAIGVADLQEFKDLSNC